MSKPGLTFLLHARVESTENRFSFYSLIILCGGEGEKFIVLKNLFNWAHSTDSIPCNIYAPPHSSGLSLMSLDVKM